MVMLWLRDTFFRSVIFKEISIFNDKGFINDAKVNIPAVDLLIKGLKFKNNDFAGSVV